MDNKRVADIFQEMGDILEIRGENRFRILAYQKAALIISGMGEDLGDIYQKNPKDLEKITGIGKDLASKIVELIKTGKCKYHEELLKGFPSGLLDILRIRGIGPKKVKLFYGELQIDTLDKLKKAAKSHQLRDLPRMGEKSELEILTAINEHSRYNQRMLLSTALREAVKIKKYMKKCQDVIKVEYAGSVRRMKETIGDLDILVSAKNTASVHEKIMDYFVKYEEKDNIIAKGSTKSSMILKSGVQVDLRVVEEKSFGAALHYFTGSKEHNIALRDRAKRDGLRINEYGVFKIIKGKEKKYIAGKTEKDVYKAVGLPLIDPLLRENRGEIEAAERGKLPKLIELSDLKGDLHVHSKWSDGNNEIIDIAKMYRDKGYEYFAISDHSPLTLAHGMTPDRLEMQWDEIDGVNDEFSKNGSPFRVLKGIECDILENGNLDLPDKTLKQFDIVTASVHSNFSLPEKEQTARILKGLSNPYVNIWGHPTGRKINSREPYSVDLSKIFNAVTDLGVVVEINSQPVRLDLMDIYCKIAKEKGVKFVINSDSHYLDHIEYLELGIAVAKRGWLEKKDVVNTMGLKDLRKFLDTGK